MYPWPLSFHIFGALIWFGGTMTAVHTMKGFAASEVRGDFKVVAASVGRIMDLGATMSIVSGIFMLTTTTGQALLKVGSMHAKFTVVLLLLGLHGFVRMQIGKYGRGEIKHLPKALPALTVSLFFAAIALIVVRPF